MIIVRFTNRDKRNDLFRRRKMLQMNSELDAIFGSASKITFKKNLTVNRKMLYDVAIDAKRDLNYKFLWTTQGRIRLRQDSESPVITVSSLFDLRKIGYSGPVRQNISVEYCNNSCSFKFICVVKCVYIKMDDSSNYACQSFFESLNFDNTHSNNQYSDIHNLSDIFSSKIRLTVLHANMQSLVKNFYKLEEFIVELKKKHLTS